jgi:hypothetical protein
MFRHCQGYRELKIVTCSVTLIFLVNMFNRLMSPVLEAGQNIAKRTLQEVAAHARAASASQVHTYSLQPGFGICVDTYRLRNQVLN